MSVGELGDLRIDRAAAVLDVGATAGEMAACEVSGVPRRRLSDALAVLAYSREVATAPPGPNGTPMTVIPFEPATP